VLGRPGCRLMNVWDAFGSTTVVSAVNRALPCPIGKTDSVAFGQQSGPQASAKQVQELLGLLKDAGHAGFRDARGPMGFTQRQAAGKFTRDEAAEFIGQLQDAEFNGSTPTAVPAWRVSAQEQMIQHMPAGLLATELRRRGWSATEP